MIQNVYTDTNKKMESSITVLQKELAGIRTGRASLALLDGVKVDYYGNLTPLNQVATLSVPESRLITIQPWDVSAVPAIEKAILSSNLGLTPANDGKIIRLSIPALTEERRKELVKVVKKVAEDTKVAIRNVRRDSMEHLKALEKDKKISQDDHKKAHDEIQKITDKFIKKVDEITAKKDKEILEV
ncbi:MAG: ribosome recycling factor [Nitrospinae bacterium]|nr:ribosome recycling factor [Nitrospinota bacterium]MBI3813682.1 ribosome recycling factor [Nitrospinota bacterium]